jgi:hypothetical protein
MEPAPGDGKKLDAKAEACTQPGVREQGTLIATDFKRQALSRPSKNGKLSGSMTTFLQWIGAEMGAAIVEELDIHPHTVEDFRELHPEIRLLVKVADVINKDLQLEN